MMTLARATPASAAKLKAWRPETTDAFWRQAFDGTNEACRTWVAGANCSDDTVCQAQCGN